MQWRREFLVLARNGNMIAASHMKNASRGTDENHEEACYRLQN